MRRLTAILATLAMTFGLVVFVAAAADASVTAPGNGATLHGNATLTESGASSTWPCSHGNSRIQLVNSRGQVVFDHYRNDDGTNGATIDTRNYPNGTYRVHGIRSDHEFVWDWFSSGCKWRTHTDDRTVHIRNVATIDYTGATSAPRGTTAKVSAKLVDHYSSGHAISGRHVTFALSDGSSVSATTNSSGVATADLPITGHARSATVTVEFAGDSYWVGDTDSAGFTVGKNSTKTTVDTPATVVHGQTTSFTARVVATNGTGTPAGTVQFTVDGSSFGNPVTLSGGVATSSPTSSLSTGTHSIGAVYSGNGDFLGSRATAATQKVDKAATTTSLEGQPTSTVHGQEVLFTATVGVVAPGVGQPTGAVQFTVDEQPYGTAVALDGDTATLRIANLHAGNHQVRATYNGDANFAASDSAQISHGVDRAATSVSVSTSDPAAVSGQPLRFTAKVAVTGPGAGEPTGSVQFFADGDPIGDAVPLEGDTATSPAAKLQVGEHEITASYSGDDDFAGSSEKLTQKVAAASTRTAVATSPNPSVFGQTVTAKATVTPVAPATGEPEGVVQFFVDGQPTGTFSALDGGVAEASLTGLSTGSHAVSAQYYSSDLNFFPSSSEQVTQQVNKAVTKVEVSSSSPDSVFGQPVTFTARVSVVAPGAGSPSGTVTFSDGERELGTVPVDSSTDEQASIQVDDLSVAQHAIVATYSGDGDFRGSTDSVAQTVRKAQTSTVLTSSANPSKSGQSVTFTAEVSPVAPGKGNPTGTVSFAINGVPLGQPATVTDGVATSTAFASLSPGTYTIEASYSGDGHFVSSRAGLDQGNGQNVTRGETSMTVEATPNPAKYGDAVTFTSTVTAIAPATGHPSGVVQVWEGDELLGASQLEPTGQDASKATFATSTLQPGAHDVRAVYVGNFNFESQTATTSATVGQVPTVTGISAGPDPATFGDDVTFTAVVSPTLDAPGAPSGTVTFTEGDTVLGTADLGAVQGRQQASIEVTGLSSGVHRVVATYSGDAEFAGSGSATFTETVERAASHLSAATVVSRLGDNAGQVRATLTGNGGAPLSGETLRFYIVQTTDHTEIQICDAVTDAEGTASCDGTSEVAAMLLAAGRYQVDFNGNGNYLPAHAEGTYEVSR